MKKKKLIKGINESAKTQGVYQKYLKVCMDAAESDYVFDTFKSNPDYTSVLEHCSVEIGVNHYREILKNNPEFMQNKKVFENDRIGMPHKYSFGSKICSPTTLQYLNVASNLKMKFGSLDGFRITEVGGGYGGQCKIICDLFQIEKYSIIDLNFVTMLQRKYLSRFDYSHKVEFLNAEDSPILRKENDLFISNYALSEMPKEVQIKYIKDIALNCRHGYITCNDTLNGIELLKEKFKVTIEPDIEGERETNYIVSW